MIQRPRRRDMGDPRVLHATAAGAELPRLLRFEGRAETLDVDWRAARVEDDTRPTDAREVALRDHPREQIRLPVPACGRRVEDAPRFGRLAGQRCHEDAESLEPEGNGAGRGRRCHPARVHPGSPTAIGALIPSPPIRDSTGRTGAGRRRTARPPGSPARPRRRGSSRTGWPPAPTPSRCSWRAPPRGAAGRAAW